MKHAWMALAVLFVAASASAQDETVMGTPKNPVPPKMDKMTHEMTPKMRQQMAKMHQQMADCLKTDRSMRDCKDEMRKNCREMLGKEECPMMMRHDDETMPKEPMKNHHDESSEGMHGD